MDDIVARFLPRFMALARARVTTALDAVSRRDFAATATMAHELHTLAGEAGLLGLLVLVPLARDSESKARQAFETRDDADAAALLDALARLATAIEQVESPLPRPESP